MKHLLTLSLTLLVMILSSAAAAEDRPNIIFILADDLGYGDLGCFGQEKIKTPRLDEMASQGMRLTNFYAGATVCAPSRCVLMTGLHTGHARVRGNGPPSVQALEKEDVTVASALRGVGYRNALIGKWGLGQEGTTGHPNDHGFDYFYGYLNQHHAHNYYPEFLWRNKQMHWLDNDVQRIGSRRGLLRGGYATKKVQYSHDLFADEAMEFLNLKHERPFFLYLALTIPHANNEATRPTGNGQEVPDYGIYKDLDWTEPNKGQAAMISRMDRDVGRILDKLTTLGIAENTLVIFTSDNGHHREGGNDPEFFDANGPLRGMKRALYEGGIRVPTIAWWPGKIAAGSASDHVAYFGDFFATAAELSGAKQPANLDSISFLPTLLGQADQQQQHEYLYWEFYEGKGARAARQGKWKAVRPTWHAPIELFDLEKDLGESQNLAAANPDKVTHFEKLIEQAHVTDSRWRVPKK